MFLSNFSLEAYRNYSDLTVDFSPNVNIFLGQNAQGKTNLLESIYFLGLTRSHRTSNDKDLIRFENDFARIKGHLNQSQMELDLEVRITNKGKIAYINHLEQAKLSNYIGKMTAILFSPEDLNLIKGAPSVRRRFMDLEFGQISSEYLYFLSQYRQVLKQKNNYLKQLSFKKANDLVFLEVLSDQLAGLGAEIIHYRLKLLSQLNEKSRIAHKELSNTSEELELKYSSNGIEFDSDSTVESMYQQLLSAYENNQAKEVRTGTTLVGPHRDDIQFTINGQDAHLFGSQGQQRTVVLSIKLAEVQLIHEITGEYPILLLDDVMSELDVTRQTALLNYIYGKTQTFITTTDLDGISWEIIQKPKIFNIANGTLAPFES